MSRSELVAKARLAIINEIIQELDDHNACIGAGKRERDRVRSDAEFIYMHRHDGITVETLAMMATDFKFAALAPPEGKAIEQGIIVACK